MVKQRDKRAEYWREMEEDYREFLEAHRIEAGYNRSKFVPARFITLPGLRLHDLERVGWIERMGFSYRPK